MLLYTAKGLKCLTDDTSVSSGRPIRARNAPEILIYNHLNDETNERSIENNENNTKNEKKKVKFELEKLEMCHNIIVDDPRLHETVEYNPNLEQVIANVMADINGNVTRRGMEFVDTFTQQYIFQKGIKKFKERGKDATTTELEQLHKRTCFSPVDISKMTPSDKAKAMDALMFPVSYTHLTLTTIYSV